MTAVYTLGGNNKNITMKENPRRYAFLDGKKKKKNAGCHVRAKKGEIGCLHGSHAYGNDEAYDNDRHENEGDYTDASNLIMAMI